MTTGESHGPGLAAIIEGLPTGLPLSEEEINYEPARRQASYGKGGGVKIKKGCVRITSGIRHSKIIGSPVTLVVEDKDWKNWVTIMPVAEVPERDQSLRRVVRPRPGHADSVGGVEYHHRDLRNVLEWSSARKTTMRIAIGAVAKRILEELGIIVAGHVICLGGIQAKVPGNISIQEIKETSEASEVRVVNPAVEQRIKELIDQTKKNGDTIGGIVEVPVGGAPAGLGNYVQWNTKLNARATQSVVSINAFKGVEFRVGFTAGLLPGSEMMDEILWEEERGYLRHSNNLGGFEGGVTNGEPPTIRGAMKPIPTLYEPLQSVDIDTRELYKASVERSDSTAVPAANVIVENIVTTVVTTELLLELPGDSLVELRATVKEYHDYLKHY